MSTLTFFRPARVSLACWWAAALFLAGGTARAEMQTQVFRLNPNWNLISFQVTPENPDAAAVFGTIPGFQSAWSYEASTGLWQRYVKPSGTAEEQADAQTANDLLRLAPIEPGRGYWVQMEGSVERWEVRGAVPSGHDFPSLRFDPGWHLIGIPVGAAVVTNREPVSLLAVLSAAGFDYDAVMTWGTNAYWKQFRPRGANHPLAGVAADPPFPAFRLQEDLGRGYWVRSLTDATLRPRLLTTLRPDMDLPPHGNFPSKEDQNVSGATNQAGLKSVRDQTVIRFFPGEEVQMVGIANQSEDERPSGGILLWEATWTPLTGTATPEPWIRLFPSRDAREERGPDGRLLGDYTRLNGVTTIESDIVYLRLDRRNLGRGRHEGILTLRTTVTNRTFQVIAEVPGVEGDFSGYAVIETVNGRRNRVPDLDLAVTFYEDASVPGLLRGLIDSSRAVMWPVDVPLVGHRITDEGNQFQLSGGYVLPPGDQNGEPFDQWDENDPAAGEDVDWLNDGKLDVRNPFPFPIQRTVLLEGALVAANPTDGQVLKGRYREVVHGLSRTPIELVGSFHLERQAVRPFTLRRSVESDTGIEPVVVARSAPPSLVIPVGESRTNRINIVTDLALHTLQVEWDFGNSTNINANLVLTLRSPGTDGRSLLLYDGRQPANAIPAEALRTVNVPLTRPPAGDFESFLRDIPRTGARPAPGLPWQLVIENRGAQPVQFPRWMLRLEGQPVTEVHGRVLSGGTSQAHALVALDGLPFSRSAVTDAEGRFSLRGVPLLPLNLSARLPGHAPEDAARAGLGDLFTIAFARAAQMAPTHFTSLEHILMARFNPLAGAPPPLAGVAGFDAGGFDSPFELMLQPVPVAAAEILAGPTEVPAGSSVTFTALGLAGEAGWDFGDGTRRETGREVSHPFKTPGLYRVRLFSPPTAATSVADVGVSILPAPHQTVGRPSGLKGESPGLPEPTANAAYTAHLFQVFGTSGGVALKATPADGPVPPPTNGFGAVLVGLMPLQHAYAASMDLDLAPLIPFGSGQSQPFAADGFQPLLDEKANREPGHGFRDEDFNYALPADVWKDTLTSQGNPEYPDRDEPEKAIVWGNPLGNPKINYATRTIQALNHDTFTVAEEDEAYHAHPGTTFHDDLEPGFQVVTHLRLACSLGAEILTAVIPSTATRVAKTRRGELANPFASPLSAAPGPVARNLHFQLHLGPLSAD